MNKNIITIISDLGLRKSSPIKVIHQITGILPEEWKRRYLYYSLSHTQKETNQRWLNLNTQKDART